MRVPAALKMWATEHNEQLSAETLDEVTTIAEAIDGSPLRERQLADIGADFGHDLLSVFEPERAERAAALVQIVASWADKLPGTAPSPATAAPPVGAEPAAAKPVPANPVPAKPVPANPVPANPGATAQPVVPAGPTFRAPTPVLPQADRASERVAAPAFLRSDKIDEEDDVRLYGPKRPWKAILSTLVALVLLGAVGAGGWYWFTQREDSSDTATTTPQVVTPAAEPGETPQETIAAPDPTVGATVEPEPAPVAPSFWADIAPILNSGTAQISASTYAVSPANRAVLTGHTAAITGVAISDDGRVLTSGADRRLVDWGSDVTLANPDVLNVPSPLTVLERTVDQRLIAGDAAGNITIIDLVNTAEPLVLPVHNVAISAAIELPDGRLAVASVDGDVAVFSVDSPDEVLTLPHNVEVTALAALDNGVIATAAVDGIIRLWPGDGSGEPGEIATLGAPVTALILTADGRLASASINGDIHVVTAVAGSTEVVVLAGHIGAVRALYEIELPDGPLALVSGGDDTTLRLWDVESQTALRVLEGHGDIISGIDSLPDGRLVSTSGDGTGRVWDLSVPDGRPVIPPHDSNLSALSPWNNDQFVTGGTDGKVVLASTAETSQPTLITAHDAPIVGIATLQSGDIVSLDASSVLRVNESSGAADGQIEINVAPGATALDVRESLGVVTGHADGTVRFHDFAEEVASIDAHGSGVNDVVALSSGLVASAGQDKTVRIIDFDNPDQLPVFDLHTAPVDVVVELPDGRIASAGSDGIYVFSVEGLAQDAIRLNGQRSRTLSLVPLSGDRLISTGDDGRIRLWDLTTPEAEPITLIDIPGVINPYLIQADNGLFVAGAARGYLVFTPS